MRIHTSDKTSPRSFPWLWFVRLPAIVFSIVVLGITASDASKWGGWECSVPSKLGYNIAVSVISFLVLVYSLLATGPSPQVRLLPWFIWGQIGLDAVMFILWLAATASSSYNCSDLCNACSAYSEVVYNSDVCFCFDNSNIYRRTYTPKPKGALYARAPRSSHSSNTGGGSLIAARQAFDAIMTIIFAFCLGATILWIVNSHQSGLTMPLAKVMEKEEEAGMPAGGAEFRSSIQRGTSADYYNGQPMAEQQVKPRIGSPTQQTFGPTTITKEGASEMPSAAMSEKLPTGPQ
ncbi:hypothetical protein N7G274_008964 [Stereocaulon virgatum]|uniref:MARVEL domain-containing protein n=1 Tax=Stereocaulon virgatum TaxID=373712 RepID=A0ABR3ZXH1_9LECA